MKIRFILFLIVTVTAGPVFSQIPNNGFENWTNTGNYSTPDNWGNLNAVTTTAGVYACVKGSPGNPGTAYLKLTSKTVSGMGVQPGIAVSGILNTSTFQAISGFAYTNRPGELDGSWQFMAGGSDQGYIAVYLTKWDAGLNKRDTIGQVVNPLPGMVMSWRNFFLPLSYSNSDIPDTAVIILSASGKNPVNGSYLYIDNLSFAGGTVGVEDHSALSGLLVFPNPVTQNKLVVNSKNREITADYIDILDLHGKLIISKTMINQDFPVSMDVSTLHPGEYFLRVTTQGITFGLKFIKQ
jgi:Secretion system C-terminal sorting domain